MSYPPPIQPINNGLSVQYAGASVIYSFSFVAWPNVTASNPIVSATFTPPANSGITVGSATINPAGNAVQWKVTIPSSVSPGTYVCVLAVTLEDGEVLPGSWPLTVQNPAVLPGG